MATGCVPVATRGVGCRELVTDGVNGYLFEPRDAPGLAGKISQVLENTHLGHRARDTILQDFNLKNNVLRDVELYKGLLEGEFVDTPSSVGPTHTP